MLTLLYSLGTAPGKTRSSEAQMQLRLPRPGDRPLCTLFTERAQQAAQELKAKQAKQPVPPSPLPLLASQLQRAQRTLSQQLQSASRMLHSAAEEMRLESTAMKHELNNTLARMDQLESSLRSVEMEATAEARAQQIEGQRLECGLAMARQQLPQLSAAVGLPMPPAPPVSLATAQDEGQSGAPAVTEPAMTAVNHAADQLATAKVEPQPTDALPASDSMAHPPRSAAVHSSRLTPSG